MYFQDLILNLQQYWNTQGCLLTQPYDIETGAGTFNPNTFLRALGPEPFNAAYVEPCRRPTDGRYGDNPNRMQHYFQFQVVMKPNPKNYVELYLGSLAAIGIKPSEHDIRFVHDDWESPTLGAWGLGWEVWVDGMEVTQFTYFQQVGGVELPLIMGEITYGLERICMFLQQVDNVYDLAYNQHFSYGDLYHENEVQFSAHNFELADVSLQLDSFARYEAQCVSLCAADKPLPATDYCLKASHAFNLLDARGAISVNERQGYILRVRTLARAIAEAWLKNREALGYPLASKPPISIDAAPPAASLADELAAAVAGAPVGDGCASLLLELGVEEMPAQVFGRLLADLPELFRKHFEPTGLDPQDVRFFVTPRRIAVSAGAVSVNQADQTIEAKGPPMKIARDADGNWTKAALGFAAKNGISIDDAEVREIKGTEYLFACVDRTGRPAVELLAEVIPEFFGAIHWYKTMRWASESTPFVRPVHWLAAVLGDAVIPTEFAGVRSGNQSQGHRFLAPQPITVTAEREAYLQTLREAYVYVDQDERKQLIRDKITASATGAGLIWREDDGLLEQVTNLVEYPVPVLCSFAERYLEIPEEVLVSEMREHQKYLALNGTDGALNHSFIAVSNTICDDEAVIREGYEAVLRARFADAEFFLREDRKQKLEERVPKLAEAIFQADLGSVLDKVERVRKLAAAIGSELGMSADQLATVDTIAHLCKTDLTTHLVGEFPDLQGQVGCYYALGEGLSAVVANGLRDHYLPRNVNDDYPSSDEAAVVGIADRVDTMVGIFGVGKVPTGSADPYALRRACLTSIAIIANRGFRIDISKVVSASIGLYANVLPATATEGLQDAILDFYLSRGTRLFADNTRSGIPGGFAKDTIEAVVQASTPWHDFTDLVARLEAMMQFRSRDDFQAVAATFKRTNNILDRDVPPGAVDRSLFSHDAETGLQKALEETAAAMGVCLEKQDHIGALAAVAPLRETVDTFFDDGPLVNDPDETLRVNRHRLVRAVVDLVIQVADFSAIREG